MNKTWPTFLQCDSGTFYLNHEGIYSQSQESNAHSYQLHLKCPPQKDSIYVEFDLQIQINTSSQNRFQFGFIAQDSVERLFSLGNTIDQLEYISPDTQIPFGIEKLLNTPISRFKCILLLTASSVHFTCFNLIDTLQEPSYLAVPFPYPIHGFLWKITQSGKNAIGKHRISNLVFAQYPVTLLPNKIIKTQILSDTLIQLHFLQAAFTSIKPEISVNLNKHLTSYKWIHATLLEVMFDPLTEDSLKLQINHITAYNGTSLDTQYQIPFRVPYHPKFGDIVFSEVLYDAIPTYGLLPEVEFIECFKRCPYNLKLKGCTLLVNQKTYLLSDLIWENDDFIIFTPTASAFADVKCISVPFNLTNVENQLALYNADGQLIDSITLHQKQQLPLFADGGWSLATTHPPTPLSSKYSWHSHGNQVAGSPGMPNQLDSLHSPLFNLEVNAVKFNQIIELEFSEPIAPNQWIYVDNDSMYYQQGTLIAMNNINSNSDSVWVRFLDKSSQFSSIIIPLWEVGRSQVEFSEIWFEAPENGDFIEFFQNGRYALNLHDMDLLLFQPYPNILTQIIPLARGHKKWFCPGEIILITQNPFYLNQQFQIPNPHQIIQISNFPNLQTNGGKVEISHHIYGRLDRADFHRSMHYSESLFSRSLVKKASGLSSAYRQHWNSFISLNYACSPGVWHQIFPDKTSQNSIHLDRRLWFIGGEPIEIPIHFNFPEEGFQLYAFLYDVWGNPLGKLCNGNFLPKTGSFTIHLEDFPVIPRNGNYVVKFEAQHIPSQKLIRSIQRLSFIYE